MKQQSFFRNLGWPGLLVLAMLIVVAAFFVYELVSVGSDPGPTAVAMSAAEVDALLEDADPTRAEALLTRYGCTACHVQGAQNGIAPPFEGVGARAAERVPGMSASAYLYDSIVHPTDYIVEGYAPSMAQDFGQRLTQQELADIVAYLLEQ